MTSDAEWLRPLREAIGRFLSEEQLDEVFDEATAAHGPLREEDGLAFVGGALDAALRPRLDPIVRRAIVRGARSILEGAVRKSIPPSIIPEIEVVEDVEPPTIPRLDHSAAYVVVIAGSKAVERSIRLVIQGDSPGCRTVGDANTLHALVIARAPGLWIIDGTDPPALTVRELRRLRELMPGPAITVVWGPGRPYGRETLKALRDMEPPPMQLAESEADALLDMVRSFNGKEAIERLTLDRRR